VVPSWLALCWTAQGSGFESQRGHLFFGISPRGEISQEGFAQELVSPPATSRYIGESFLNFSDCGSKVQSSGIFIFYGI
jgi:hypothetical protein